MSRMTRGVLALILALLVAAPAMAAEFVRLSNGEWPPMMSHAAPDGGSVTKLVTDAFAAVGVTALYDFLPWPRAYEAARFGKNAGSVGWQRRDDRQQWFYYSDSPVMIGKETLFYRADHPIDWTTVEDLYGKRLAGGLGYYYGAEMDEAERANRLTLERHVSETGMIKMLLAGRVDAIILNEDVGRYLLQTQFSAAQRAAILVHPKPVHEGRWYLILSKAVPGNDALMERFNRGMAAVAAARHQE